MIELTKIDIAIHKACNGRFELRIANNGRVYMIDYHEDGKLAVVKSYEEILDIIDNNYLEEFGVDKIDLQSLRMKLGGNKNV